MSYRGNGVLGLIPRIGRIAHLPVRSALRGAALLAGNLFGPRRGHSSVRQLYANFPTDALAAAAGAAINQNIVNPVMSNQMKIDDFWPSAWRSRVYASLKRRMPNLYTRRLYNGGFRRRRSFRSKRYGRKRFGRKRSFRKKFGRRTFKRRTWRSAGVNRSKILHRKPRTRFGRGRWVRGAGSTY